MATIVVDTRQQEGKHRLKHEQMRAQGFELLRSKLPFGDYALPSLVAVDTKQNIQELAQNVHHDHTRFRNECVGARDAGVKLIILVETTEGITSLESLSEWIEPESQFRARRNAKTPISGKNLARACETMQERYGVEFRFCKPEESALEIIEILTKGV